MESRSLQRLFCPSASVPIPCFASSCRGTGNNYILKVMLYPSLTQPSELWWLSLPRPLQPHTHPQAFPYITLQNIIAITPLLVSTADITNQSEFFPSEAQYPLQNMLQSHKESKPIRAILPWEKQDPGHVNMFCPFSGEI